MTPPPPWQTLTVTIAGIWTDLGPNTLIDVRFGCCPRTPAPAPAPILTCGMLRCGVLQGSRLWQIDDSSIVATPFSDVVTIYLNDACPCGGIWVTNATRELDSCPPSTSLRPTCRTRKPRSPARPPADSCPDTAWFGGSTGEGFNGSLRLLCSRARQGAHAGGPGAGVIVGAPMYGWTLVRGARERDATAVRRPGEGAGGPWA